MRRCLFGMLAVLAVVAPGPSALAKEQKIGDPPEARDMRLVGYSDLQARSAYQPTIHLQNGRWIAYVGHHGGIPKDEKPLNPLTGQHESNGTSLIDVTDPHHPKYLAHIPGDEGEYEAGGAQMVRVCDGKTLPKGDPAKTYMLRTFGNSAHEIWDTSDPAQPQFSRNFGLPRQQPGAAGDVPTSLHGMISTGPQGNRVYFGYGTNGGGMLQIVDRDKLINGPKDPTPENLLAPQVSLLQLSSLVGAHTTFPVLGVKMDEFSHDKTGSVRDFVVITDEQIANECGEARQMVWFVDITVETRPQVVSNFYVPEASGDYCSRGGRFGTHSSNENMTPIYYKKIMFFSHFNAGVRAVDIRNPFRPREIGYFIPAITKNTDPRCIKVNGQDRCKVAIQTNNVEVDDRGYIYIVDRANTGMHILELTGEARKIAGLPPVK